MNDQGGKWPRLLSLAVHELRTPMTVVAGYLRMLLRNPDEPLSDAQRRLLQEAEKACGRLTGLVAEMSDLIQVDLGEAPFNRGRLGVDRLILDAVAAAALLAPGRAAPEVRSQEVAGSVEGDAKRLHDAFVSILQAASRETLDEHPLVIAVARQTVDGVSCVRVAIAAESNITELASTPVDRLSGFDEWRGGHGLRLPLARRIVEAHGGRVFSPPGEPAPAGAVVILPLVSVEGA